MAQTMMHPNLPSSAQPQLAPSPTLSSGTKRNDPVALAFLLACGLLAGPLLFAARLPTGLVILTSLALLAVFVVRGLLTHSWLPRTAVDGPNVVLLLLLPIGLWASTDQTAAWPVVCKVIAGFALFYGVAGLANTRWSRMLPWGVLAISVGLALFISTGTSWYTSKFPWMPETVYQALPTILVPWRTYGFHPNVTGGAIAYLLLPAVALTAWSQERRIQAAAAVTALLLALVLLLSQSRGAWLAAAVALIVMPILRYRRWWIVLTAASVLVAAIWLASGREFLPIPAAQEASFNTLPGRLELWTRALAIVRDFGPAGIGPGQFEQVVMVLYPPFFTGLQGNFHHAHNLYLQAAVDFGVMGLVAFAALLLGIGAGIVDATKRWSVYDRANQPLAALATGVFGSLLAVAAHGLVDATLVAPPTYALVLALFGAAMASASQLLAQVHGRGSNTVGSPS